MAGVGFELKKLFTARTAAGHLRAYSYSVIITAGPFFLLTSMVLAIQFLFHSLGIKGESAELFTASVIYSFVFSQILSSGFTMVLTRYLADSLSLGRYQDIMASLFGMGAILTVLSGLTAGAFFWGSPLPAGTKWLAYLFFAQQMLVWTENVYLSAVKQYKRLLLSYLAGVMISIALAAWLLTSSSLLPEQAGLLAVNAGMGLMVLLLLLHIAAYFGAPEGGMNFAFLPYLERHWRLFFISFSYMAGLFLPNILIWQGPWGVEIGGTFRYAPVYDVVTFYAFLSILPLMTMFVVSVETTFYERYSVYFSYITRKGNFREIDDARKDLLHTLWFELRHIVEFQLVFTLIFLALGGYILSEAGITSSQVNMFQVILFGAFFTGLFQLICILMVYFDYQQEVLRVALWFLGSHFLFGMLGLHVFGEASYGFTFFLAAAGSFLFGFCRLNHFAGRINYFVFCAQPVFYCPPAGWLTRLVRWLYGDRYVDLGAAKEEDGYANEP